MITTLSMLMVALLFICFIGLIYNLTLKLGCRDREILNLKRLAEERRAKFDVAEEARKYLAGQIEVHKREKQEVINYARQLERERRDFEIALATAWDHYLNLAGSVKLPRDLRFVLPVAISEDVQQKFIKSASGA